MKKHIDAPFAPVALFTYNRIYHTEKVVNALKENEESLFTDLYIFSDGPKDDHHNQSVSELREYLKKISGFNSITLIFRETNFGLSRNIVDGVSFVLKRHENIIVLEDDILVTKYFLDFMNTSLKKYKNCDDVCCIQGYVYPTKGPRPNNFFLIGAECWGWATWNTQWSILNLDGAHLYHKIKSKGLSKQFDYGGYSGFTSMLEKNIHGKNDSWAIRWHASAFLKGRLTLYPGTSLLKNIGMDGTGVHSDTTSIFDCSVANAKVNVDEIEVVHSKYMENEFKKFFFKTYFKSKISSSFLAKTFIIFVPNRIKSFLKKVLTSI